MTIISHLQISKGTYAILFCWSSPYVISIRLYSIIASMTQKSDQEILLHESAVIVEWFPNGYVESQTDVYTYVNGDVEMPFFNMTTW